MDRIKQIINEELSKSDVSSMINDKLSSYLRKREIETLIKDMVADSMEKFFRMMYNKRGFWKNEIKN